MTTTLKQVPLELVEAVSADGHDVRLLVGDYGDEHVICMLYDATNDDTREQAVEIERVNPNWPALAKRRIARAAAGDLLPRKLVA